MSNLETMDNINYNNITRGSQNSDVVSLARYLIEYKIGKYLTAIYFFKKIKYTSHKRG